MTKEQIANSINEFFKDYDTYNYRDNVSHRMDEEETEISFLVIQIPVML